MSFRTRFNRIAAGVLVLLWFFGVTLLAAAYFSGMHTGWGLILLLVNAPMIYKLLAHAVGEGPVV